MFRNNERVEWVVDQVDLCGIRRKGNVWQRYSYFKKIVREITITTTMPPKKRNGRYEGAATKTPVNTGGGSNINRKAGKNISSGRRETLKQKKLRLEQEKLSMSRSSSEEEEDSDEEEDNHNAVEDNDDDGQNNDSARGMYENEDLNNRYIELEAEVIDLRRKVIEYEDIHENCEMIIEQLKVQVDGLENSVQEAEKESENMKNLEPITMDGVEYDRVSTYVRKTMFRKVKFISDNVLDSVKKGSMGHAITEAFNINADEILSWWHCYKQAAHHGISQSRNGKMTEIKNSFKSKNKYMLLYIMMNILYDINTLLTRSLLNYRRKKNIRRGQKGDAVFGRHTSTT
jgi:hypothetical protein